MPYTQILTNIQKHITMDQEEQDFFIGLLSEKNINKKEFVLSKGEACKNFYYVNSGLLRAYYLDTEGKESTVMFAIKDWWITDMYCFINEKPSMLCIQAVEKSNVLSLSKGNMDMLYLKVPKFERFFRVIMQNAYIREQLRVIQSLSLTAEERYNNFILKYPDIVQQVTQKQIASYLGITPEFLSYIRASKHAK